MNIIMNRIKKTLEFVFNNLFIKYRQLPSILLLVSALPNNVSAHVAYVVGHEEMSEKMGMDFDYILNAILSVDFLVYSLASIVAVLVIWHIAHKYTPVKRNLAYARTRLESYHELIPWILRLSLGITLIGAGSEQVLISPVLDGMSVFSTVQIIIGFLYLLGFLLVPVTIVTIILYILALSTDVYLIGNIDVLALALGFLVFHSARPGLDDMLGFNLLSHIRIKREYLAPMVRAGIGISMIFLAFYEKILNPHMAELVVNEYSMTEFIKVDPSLWVAGAGIVELVVGLFLLIGLFTRSTACVAFIVLTVSFFFFKESVASHVTLFGILSIVAIEGGGKWSVDKWWQKKNKKG